jgi:hypothetical protein
LEPSLLSTRLCGSVPVTDQLNGATPLVAWTVALYGTPVSPLGIEAGTSGTPTPRRAPAALCADGYLRSDGPDPQRHLCRQSSTFNHLSVNRDAGSDRIDAALLAAAVSLPYRDRRCRRHVYLADGQKDLARQTAEKALALLVSHAAQASSWSNTEARRKFIRDSAQQNLKQLGAAQ